MPNILPNEPACRSLLIRRAQLLGRGRCDLRVTDGRIAALAPDIPVQSGECVIAANGHTLVPGLNDHHLHLFATAAARESVDCGPPAVGDEESLRDALRQASAAGTGFIRGVGFHDSVCARLDRHWLDRVCPDRPVRIQHRSGMLWVLNSCALEQLHIEAGEELPSGAERAEDGTLAGRFYDLGGWLGARLERSWPSLHGLSRELARFGITGVTDTGARNGREAWAALNGAAERGELLQRLLVMGNEELHGLSLASPERVGLGPLKIYLREAALPAYDSLVRRIESAHDHARPIAVHCVTRVELHYALAALADAVPLPGDRIEHASVVDDHALERLAALGVAVVTQPHFIVERGDQYLADVDAEDQPLLYRGAGFLCAGVSLAAGSDAPYGATDPWAAMRAAVTRRTRDGVQMMADECLTPLQALALFAGDLHRPGSGLRELGVGQSADLCLVDVPFETLCDDLDARHVALTLCGGTVAYATAAVAKQLPEEIVANV